MIYGSERGNISQNKDFYNKNQNTNKQFIYPELSAEYNVDDVKFSEVDEGEIRATVNW